jgi:5-(carboxyamino)imidazole ribonucleotide mutase
MPGGIPVGTLAIGEAGAKNAGLLAVRILANTRPGLRQKLHAYHADLAAKVRQETLP